MPGKKSSVTVNISQIIVYFDSARAGSCAFQSQIIIYFHSLKHPSKDIGFIFYFLGKGHFVSVITALFRTNDSFQQPYNCFFGSDMTPRYQIWRGKITRVSQTS